ncbi:hypothetical protein Lesp02_46400 [Lentzea sp. NBRC 105346]|uniref:hypothetical protein n=1 Tax=Lentzea sp. NBRC 105346 TaxID=3032205 RepID=UPI0024A0DE7F|nr:hypothetical protein [Lentzea sp. NBRC 105346]GLZ32452.1 hypothetical protein Lesp02_46400 [Lentzea sp. NBRC 105346]
MVRKSAALGLAALAAVVVLAMPGQASAGSKTKLFLRFATKSACTVHLNYPKEGVVANSTFTVPTGKTIVWRYNVNETWALISYQDRAHKQFPWWGFTKRDCIGKSIKQSDYPAGHPVPDKILEGRSRVASDGWRRVTFNVPAAPVAVHHKKVTRNATLRDDANFVIGNVKEGWHVDVTNVTRSNGHWVEVYVPNAKRWAYIERAALA